MVIKYMSSRTRPTDGLNGPKLMEG